MAGTLKTNAVQLGDSATATQNLTIRTNADGSFTIARGNAGATTQDVLTIDANGRIALPQSVVAFTAWLSVAQSLATGVATKLIFQTKEVDTNNFYDTTTGKFQPLVPGWYQVSGGFQHAGTATLALAYVYKNGSLARVIARADSTGGVAGSTLIYLNGSTDYVEFWAQQNGTATTAVASQFACFFQGVLIAKA